MFYSGAKGTMTPNPIVYDAMQSVEVTRAS